MKPFVIRQIVQINSGAFGGFSAELVAPILVQWVPCPCFPLFNHYFYKKLNLYINILNIYLWLGRKELGISLCVSVVRGFLYTKQTRKTKSAWEKYRTPLQYLLYLGIFTYIMYAFPEFLFIFYGKVWAAFPPFSF